MNVAKFIPKLIAFIAGFIAPQLLRAAADAIATTQEASVALLKGEAAVVHWLGTLPEEYLKAIAAAIGTPVYGAGIVLYNQYLSNAGNFDGFRLNLARKIFLQLCKARGLSLLQDHLADLIIQIVYTRTKSKD